MINKMLGKVGGVDTFYILSMFIFIAFFVGVTVLLIKMKKSRAEYLKNIPMTDDNQLFNNN